MPNRSCSAGNIRFKGRKFDIVPLFYERSTSRVRKGFGITSATTMSGWRVSTFTPESGIDIGVQANRS